MSVLWLPYIQLFCHSIVQYFQSLYEYKNIKLTDFVLKKSQVYTTIVTKNGNKANILQKIKSYCKNYCKTYDEIINDIIMY